MAVFFYADEGWVNDVWFFDFKNADGSDSYGINAFGMHTFIVTFISDTTIKVKNANGTYGYDFNYGYFYI